MWSSEETCQALLELGLEDWIPIPEALTTPEVCQAIGQGDPVQAVGEALAALVLDGLVALYRGRWDEDPERVATAVALELLRDPRWYSFHTADLGEERLYFVNVKNIRES
jgi:hypothetical protein